MWSFLVCENQTWTCRPNLDDSKQISRERWVPPNLSSTVLEWCNWIDVGFIIQGCQVGFWPREAFFLCRHRRVPSHCVKLAFLQCTLVMAPPSLRSRKLCLMLEVIKKCQILCQEFLHTGSNPTNKWKPRLRMGKEGSPMSRSMCTMLG